jgi:hypothetical protein
VELSTVVVRLGHERVTACAATGPARCRRTADPGGPCCSRAAGGRTAMAPSRDPRRASARSEGSCFILRWGAPCRGWGSFRGCLEWRLTRHSVPNLWRSKRSPHLWRKKCGAPWRVRRHSKQPLHLLPGSTWSPGMARERGRRGRHRCWPPKMSEWLRRSAPIAGV